MKRRFLAAVSLCVFFTGFLEAQIPGSGDAATSAVSGDWKQLTGGNTDGLNGTVQALTVYDGALYAGGYFTWGSGKQLNGIARWDGTQWQPVGTLGDDGVNGAVLALTVYNGSLYAGGTFTKAGSIPVYGIARWDGTAWFSLGTGDANGIRNGFNPTVEALAVFNNALFAGGNFSHAGGISAKNIARWDGTSWNSVGAAEANGVNNTVRALTVYNNQLIAGGFFTAAGGAPANRLAAWSNGSWKTLGSAEAQGVNAPVYTLAVHNNALFAGGVFTQAAGITANRIVKWDGTTYTAVGNGLNAHVNALATFNNALIVGGFFTQANGVPANRIARWDGTVWTSVGADAENGVGGTNTTVYALAVNNSALYVGGSFTYAGSRHASRIARWGSGIWTTVGDGPAAGVNNTVRALAVLGKDLFAGGTFTKAGGADANLVGIWNGTTWKAFDVAYPFAAGNQINAMIVFNNELYIGGMISPASAPERRYLALRWTGTAWQPVGEPIASEGVVNVNAFVVYNGKLFAGGSFTLNGTNGGTNIAGLNGDVWEKVGNGSVPGVNNEVHTLAVYNEALYAGGRFTQAGNVEAKYIARWTGAAGWSSISDEQGNGTNSSVNTLAVFNNALFVGGAFTEAAGKPATFIARWNGTVWSAVGAEGAAGVNNIVNSLKVYQEKLFIGGNFTEAGGSPAAYLAIWEAGAFAPVQQGNYQGVSGLAANVWAMEAYNKTLITAGSFTRAGEIPVTNIASYLVQPTAQDKSDALPGKFSLHQNFPNPFNPATVISFELDRPAQVTLEVYSLTGAKLATLFEGKGTSGINQVSFNASGLASGVYMYRLTAGGRVESRKMTLIK